MRSGGVRIKTTHRWIFSHNPAVQSKLQAEWLVTFVDATNNTGPKTSARTGHEPG